MPESTDQEAKHWFRHSNGFVNINATGIWFTSSGNWTELEQISEKQRSNRSKASKNKWKARTYLLMIIAIAFAAVIAYVAQGDGSPLLLFALIAAMLFYGFRYFRRNLSVNFFIPWAKLKQLDSVEPESLLFTFTNGDGQKEDHMILEVAKKDQERLRELMLNQTQVEPDSTAPAG